MNRAERRRQARSLPRARRCPDCNAVYTTPGTLHLPECPVQADISRVVEDDQLWFAAHPDARERTRPSTWGERTEAALVGGSAGPSTTVVYVSPNRRVRFFGGALTVDGEGVPDDLAK